MKSHGEMMQESADRLEAILSEVKDEASFLRFVRALAEDWEDDQGKEGQHYDVSPSGWVNGSIGQFLECAHAWGEAWLGQPVAMVPDNNPWQRAAAILYGGKHYE